MEKEKMVSIITPVYNVEKYLGETIDSVINQTYKNWEMIIVDDCSIDGTFSIATDYSNKDCRIKVFKLEKNSGVANARNFGLKMASGNYIAFLDGDDLWMPDKTKKQIDFMEKNNYSFSYTFYQHFYDSTKKYGKIIKSPKMIKAKDLLKSNFIGCLTVIINKEQVGDFFMPNLRYAEDSLTWEMILNRGFTAYCLPEVCAYYRKSDSSATHKKTNAAKQRWKLYRDYYHFSFFKSFFYFVQYLFYSVKKHF